MAGQPPHHSQTIPPRICPVTESAPDPATGQPTSEAHLYPGRPTGGLHSELAAQKAEVCAPRHQELSRLVTHNLGGQVARWPAARFFTSGAARTLRAATESIRRP